MTVPSVDSANNGTSTTGATSLSWSHVNAGNYLIVALSFNGAHSNLAVTYNGVAMSEIVSIANGSNRKVYLFGLINPPVGTYNVSATWTTSRAVIGTSISLLDAYLVAAAIASVSGTSSPTSISLPVEADCLGVDAVFGYNGSNNTVPALTSSGSGQTARTTQSFTGGSSAARLRQSTITGSGTATPSWTASNFTELLQIGIVLRGLNPSNFFLAF